MPSQKIQITAIVDGQKYVSEGLDYNACNHENTIDGYLKYLIQDDLTYLAFPLINNEGMFLIRSKEMFDKCTFIIKQLEANNPRYVDNLDA